MRLALTQCLTLSLFATMPALLVSGQGVDGDLMEWTSTVGTSVVARLVGEDSKQKTVTLEKANGKQITVLLDKLSDESRKVALKLIRELRKQKNVVGTWYWRCPAKTEPDFRITSTLVRSGRFYKLAENSTGHSQSPDSKQSYFYRKVGDLFWAVDSRNGGEKRLPFTIDSKGDRITYRRPVVVGDNVFDQGGDFLDIDYTDKEAAEAWARKNDTFPPIEIPTRRIN